MHGLGSLGCVGLESFGHVGLGSFGHVGLGSFGRVAFGGSISRPSVGFDYFGPLIRPWALWEMVKFDS